MDDGRPIGVFDSGIGGLSVLQRIREHLPYENLVYVADARYLPYGDKPPELIETRALCICQFLTAQKAKAVVVACNTATAAAIARMRERFSLPIIGMEPGIKPALAMTRSGVVGVLATRETLSSRKFESLVTRFGGDKKLVVQACPGLVEVVEQLALNSAGTRALVARYVGLLLDQGADTLVLGCTHYPWLSDLIQEIAGPGIVIIDTGEAVAREVSRRLKAADVLTLQTSSGMEQFYTTGELAGFEQVVARLWSRSAPVMALPAGFGDGHTDIIDFSPNRNCR
ncbi:MAG: glutamate racemase [Desulfatitalea sp.]|nr:glutamate racemase [Desulfatitalea sp.]NNK02273.1 glutamate racemase [Desulfatitalea sp.]